MVFQHLASFALPDVQFEILETYFVNRNGKNVTGSQYVWYQNIMGNAKTSKYDQAGLMSEII